jgi:hypothetical protein
MSVLVIVVEENVRSNDCGGLVKISNGTSFCDEIESVGKVWVWRKEKGRKAKKQKSRKNKYLKPLFLKSPLNSRNKYKDVKFKDLKMCCVMSNG